MHLKSLKVLHIKGDEQKIKDFLQGQVSSDILSLENNYAQLSCICNQKGLVMAEFIIKKIDSQFKIIIDGSLADIFIEDLAPYAKFFGVTFTEGEEMIKGTVQINASEINNDTFYLYNMDFGLQMEISNDLSLIPSEISYQEWLVANKLLSNYQMCAEDVGLYRPLELNYDKLRVSYTKGCFRGQEIIARMHYLGVNRRTFCTVIEDTNHPIELDIKITGDRINYKNYDIYNCCIENTVKEKIESQGNHQLIQATTN